MRRILVHRRMSVNAVTGGDTRLTTPRNDQLFLLDFLRKPIVPSLKLKPNSHG